MQFPISRCSLRIVQDQITSDKESGLQFIDQLMDRQDTVLTELDQLNARVELLIKELTIQRSEDSTNLSSIELANAPSPNLRRVA